MGGSIIFFDDFSGYPTGSSMPLGPWLAPSTGYIYNFGVNPQPNACLGGAGASLSATTYLGPQTNFSLFMSFAIGASGLAKFAGPLLKISNGNPFQGHSIDSVTLLSVEVEDDWSISLEGPGSAGPAYPPGYYGNAATVQPANTALPSPGAPPFWINAQQLNDSSLYGGGLSWHYLYMTVNVTTGPPPDFIIGVAASLSIDAGAGTTNGGITTGISALDTYLGYPGAVNEFTLSADFGEGAFGNFAITTLGVSYPTPTLPPAFVNARLSQLVVELLSQPTPNARLSQLAVELLSLPPSADRNARLSQLAVELMYGYNPSPSSGTAIFPQYIKRRNLLANT